MPRNQKSQLEQALDDIGDVKATLQNVNIVTATRQDLAEAVRDSLETLEDYEAAETEDEDDSDSD